MEDQENLGGWFRITAHEVSMSVVCPSQCTPYMYAKHPPLWETCFQTYREHRKEVRVLYSSGKDCQEENLGAVSRQCSAIPRELWQERRIEGQSSHR